MRRSILFLIVYFTTLSVIAQTAEPQFPTMPWRMYHLDREFYNHNSISPGDANKDGYDDYVVIHEGPDKVTILFHPGNLDDIYGEWEKVVISEGNNVEYAYFGDLDGDGNLDIAYANVLVDGALDILMKENDRDKHNQLVKEKIESIQEQVDVIVLAQGSMVVLLPELEHIQTPVLSSPRLGVERMCAMVK